MKAEKACTTFWPNIYLWCTNFRGTHNFIDFPASKLKIKLRNVIFVLYLKSLIFELKSKFLVKSHEDFQPDQSFEKNGIGTEQSEPNR